MKGKYCKELSGILVVSMIGMGSFSYIPTVHAEGSDVNNASPAENSQLSTLTKLEIGGIPLDQSFSEVVTSYTATVENSVTQIQLLLESSNPDAQIAVNGALITDGKTGPLSLQPGENVFLITVSDGTQSTNVYTLKVTRKKSSNNLLKTITLSKGELSPKFDSSIFQYNVNVTNEIDSLLVTPEAIENTAKISVNNIALEQNGNSIKLPIGKSDITITVTAENGEQKTYILHVTRAAKQSNGSPAAPTKPSTNPSGAKTNTPTGSWNSSNGQQTTSRGQSAPVQNHYSQSAAQQNYNGNQSATQQNASAAVQKTSTATLSSLTVSKGTWDSDFSKSEYTYHIAVPSDTEEVTINPKATYSNASALIGGGTDKTVKLTGSKTIVNVQVTKGEDRKTYVLVFEKPVQTTTTAAVTTETTAVSANSDTSNASSQAAYSKGTHAKANWQPQTANNTSFWYKIVSFFKNIFS